MDIKEQAAFIVKHVGGKENVSSLTHCVTRLRFVLKDETKADTELIKERKDVLGVIQAGGQYQVCIGPGVGEVFNEVESLIGDISNHTDTTTTNNNKNIFNRCLETLASLFSPSIAALTAGGLIKAVLSLLTACNIVTNTSQTYLIFSYIGDAVFYFLPFLLAYGTAKRFKADIGLALMMAGVFLYPSLAALYTNAEGAAQAVHLFGFLPVTQAVYSSTVAPIILSIIFMSYVQHFLEKHIPAFFKPIGVPLFTAAITAVAGLVVLGPLGTLLSNVLMEIFMFLDTHVSFLVPTLIGAFMPYMVMTGTHLAVTPLAVQSMAVIGKDSVVGPGGLASNLAQGTAALAVGLTTKKHKDMKSQALSAGFTGLLGITEPALYGVNLKLRYPLIACMIGGGLGGLFLGITHAGRYAMGPSSLLMLTAYIGGDSMNNFYCGIIGALISIVVTFIATVILCKRDEAEK